MNKGSRELLGALTAAVGARLESLAKDEFVRRLWEKDPSLWTGDGETAEKISNRLGWLDLFPDMRERKEEIRRFASEVRSDSEHVLLLGMGGSSLCPEVMSLVFGAGGGFPRLSVLDSTDPAAVRAAEVGVAPGGTSYVVASKSGTTAEVDAFYRYFASRQSDGSRFLAITDPGSPLERLGRERGFRKVFLNPPDIGGRYSALSFFGLVPAALLGIDIGRLLSSAEAMGAASGPSVPPAANPAVRLGVLLAEAALAGRDKATLLFSPEIAPFGAWVEQLLAESSGKEGKGILPVHGENLADPSAYGEDRFFIFLRYAGTKHSGPDRRVAQIEALGLPIVSMEIEDLHGLGGEYLRWEIATAVCCSLLGVNAFDEPNVKDSKDRTGAVLRRFEEEGNLGEEAPLVEDGVLRLYADPGLRPPGGEPSTTSALRAHLERTKRGDFLALLAYLEPSSENEARLQAIRTDLAERTGLATSLGFGPRFLHSTGQLFKGGPNKGVFLQLTAEDEGELPIPGLPYSFGLLKRAQAMGDLEALFAHGRRVVRCHGKGGAAELLGRLAEMTRAALSGSERRT